jgi:hypothetical protein
MPTLVNRRTWHLAAVSFEPPPLADIDVVNLLKNTKKTQCICYTIHVYKLF